MLSLSDPVLQTVLALLLAHVVADFIFQPNWMVEKKQNLSVLLCHVAIVFAMSVLALGGGWIPAVIVAVLHLLVDAIKIWWFPKEKGREAFAFFADQIAHVLTIFFVTYFWSDVLGSGWWAPWIGSAMKPAIFVTGFLVVVYVGGYAVGAITSIYASEFAGQGLPNAGKIIGQLERILIFLLILIDKPEAIGFLIAAKSLLRFRSSKEQKTSEYVIIGTLSSFVWALAFSLAISKLLDL